jgi:hypothetical protein
VWSPTGDAELWLTLGSPRIRAELAEDPAVTVHLDSGTDVIIVEGDAVPATGDLAPFLSAYDAKYDWKYDAETYGAPTRVVARDVLAWRSGGFAGRDGFQQAGRFTRR